MFDENQDGTISCDELLKLIKKLGGRMTEGQAKALLTLVGQLRDRPPHLSCLSLFRLTRMTMETLTSTSSSLCGI